ncbi:MAG: hypothetical protein AAB701_01515 [Patescibacteria group bacterium]
MPRQAPVASTPTAPLRAAVQARVATQPPVTAVLPKVKLKVPRFLYGVAGLVVVGGLLVGLSESGVLALGIEQFWGLSNRAEQAIALGAKTLTSAGNYQVTVRATIEDILPTDASTVEFSRLIVEFVEDRSGATSKASGNVTFQPAPGQEELFGTALAGGAPVAFETIQSDGDVYLRLPDQDPANQWQKVSFTQLSDLGIKANGWPALVTALTESVSKGQRLPKQQLENVSTKGYQTNVAASALVAPFSTTAIDAEQQLAAKTQVGIGDKRPYAVALDGPVATKSLRGTLHATANFSSFGSVATVVAPTADMVKNTSPLLFMSDHGLLKADSLIGRDVQRKADLRALTVALVEYAAAQRPFAYPKFDSPVRIEPGSEIAKLLEPYLSPIPTDPVAATRYYGYRSTGTGFELTASLENSADPTGTQEGSLVLYRVKSQ